MLNQILCIDDDPITLMLCKKVIAKSNFCHEIITSSNGEDALQHFTTMKENASITRPDLIFLDLNMPIMGGWEFLNFFKKTDFSEFKTIKVVVLSSTIDPEDLEKSKQYEMVIDFLPKPISTQMLIYLSDKMGF